MKHRASWTQKLISRMELQGESVPLQPILELYSDRRVWIENHRGVRQYTPEQLCVAVRYGQICICGSDLHLSRMQGSVLVITGKIESISVVRGCK